MLKINSLPTTKVFSNTHGLGNGEKFTSLRRTFVQLSHEPRSPRGGINIAIRGLLSSKPVLRTFSSVLRIGPAEWPNSEGHIAFRRPVVQLKAAFEYVVGSAVESLERSVRRRLAYIASSCDLQFAIETETEAPFDTTVLVIRLLEEPCSPTNLSRANATREVLNRLGIPVPALPDRPPFDDNILMGLLIAKPAFRAADLLLTSRGHARQALFCGHEYFSLPFLYLAQEESRSPYRTAAYLSQNHAVTELIDADMESGGTGVERYRDLDNGPTALAGIERHPSYGLLGAVSRLDCVAAVSPSVVRELRAMHPCLQRARIDVVPHGIDPCLERFNKARAKQTLLSQLSNARIAPLTNDPLLLLKIARPDKCKALRRDLWFLMEFDRLLRKDGRRALYLIVTYWPEDTRTRPHKRIASRDSFLVAVEQARSTLENTDIVLVEEFDFPTSLGLSRTELLQATDVTLALSSYESFGIAAIEGIPYGAVTVISSTTGSCAWMCQRRPNALACHPSVVIADYLETYDDLERSETTAARVEQLVGAKAARAVLARLSISSDDRIACGRELTREVFDWEIAGELFARRICELFAEPRQKHTLAPRTPLLNKERK